MTRIRKTSYLTAGSGYKQKMTEPRITVLMPVYNGERYLCDAIQSILSQTLGDFEFLIINDGSTDRSVEIINSYRDPRIRLIHNDQNMQLIATLNKGLDMAQGEYIARMDSDDISLPERLENQVAFLDAHPEVGICGTWIRTFGNKKGSVWNYPTDDATIRSRFIFESVIAHPSVMIRKDMLENADLRYNPLYKHAEDYGLWVAASKHTNFANIGKILLHHRLHPLQVGQSYSEDQQSSADLIRRNQIENLGVRPTEEELSLHRSISMWRIEASREFILRAGAWLCKLVEANCKTSNYPEPAFSRVLGERWYWICSAAAALGMWTWRAFWRSPLGGDAALSRTQMVKFWGKCILRYGVGNA